MTYLASSWQLWKLQFRQGSVGSLSLRFLQCFSIFFLLSASFVQSLLLAIFAPFLVVFSVSNSLLPDTGMYRAFGMGRKRAYAHAALSVVPVVALVSVLVLWWFPPNSALIGVASAVVTGVFAVLVVDPQAERSFPGADAAGVTLARSGGFGWVTLWRRVLTGSVVFGLFNVAAQLVSGIAPWEWLSTTLNSVVVFVFWFWFAYMLAQAAGAWKAFGRSRRDWVCNIVVASLVGAMLFAATAVVVLGILSLAGAVPAGVDFARISGFTWATIPVTVAIALASVASGASSSAIVFFTSIVAWTLLRGMIADGNSPRTFFWFALIFAAVLFVVAAFQFWRTLTERTSLQTSAGDYRGINQTNQTN
ncbi:hypothetical protein [Corynebacterium cystitidis]|uniref:Uncharacterized protein n=1 Tax=Corynebacterium cystitidis DSM 20524 TaxID=1121357 RepID=A0A1H9V0X1_9CORY|nr:hypothetical protein [Corynebacterium cystitidis]WJY83612.1 hypothetical protein CCYS_13655 [Corynebacterium cystitidis DSM 20524]SES14927.1 hypothetical protein SAMN05661109_02024 [Corynebacterium cystitidis DSM 20524]SNV91743.1 Uncharacterised protein [Corynebacterium cystitidis]